MNDLVIAPVTVGVASAHERQAWESFRESRPERELGHRWGMLELMERVFRVEVFGLVARRGGTIVALLPLVHQRSPLGRFLTSVPWLNYAGVLGDDAGARHALAQEASALAARLGVHRLELRGREGGDLPLPPWPGKATYTLELPERTDELWDALGAKVRAQVKRPQKAGHATRVGEAGSRSAFYRLLARRWHELGTPILPERFFAELEAVAGDRLDYLTVVAPDGRVAAAGLIVQEGEAIEIPWAASAEEHHREGVNMLLYWTALERAVEKGARRFDFGRSTPGSGNARFKLQWGAREVPLAWNVLARAGRGRASERGSGGRDLVAAAWRRLPAPVARTLGPFLAARIPL